MAAAEQQQEQQQQQQAASDGSQHDNDDQPHAMAEITATGLRLTDAEGMSSLVPLHDLKEVMMRLTFST